MQKKVAYLQRLYETAGRPSSYQSLQKILKTVRKEKKFKISEKFIKKWLQSIESYTVHKRPVRKFPRVPIIVQGIGDQYDADLMHMINLSLSNKGYRYVLVVTDVFKRKVWAEPMKLKNDLECIRAFKRIFSRGCPKPKRLRTDRGGEFVGSRIDKYFKDLGIYHFVTWNEVKANYAERAIQTIKKKIFRYLTQKRTRTYIDVLQDIVKSYNNTYHSSIRMAPNEVTKKNEKNLWWQLYISLNANNKKYKPFKYMVGDNVRVSVKRSRLEREYDERWSNEIFRIRRRFYNKGIKLYQIEDYSGTNKKGSYYEAELQQVTVKRKELWRVDYIRKSRGKGSSKEVLVHWHGWPKKYDQWIPARDLV